MKKTLCFALISIVFSTVSFAMDKPEMYVDGSLSVPVRFNLSPNNFNQDPFYSETNDYEYQIMGSVGLDSSFTAMFSQLFGGYANIGFFFPIGEQAKYSYKTQNAYASQNSISNQNSLGFYETKNAKSTVKFTDTDFWWGFKTLLAPSVRPLCTERFDLIVSPGFAFSSTYREFSVSSGNIYSQTKKLYKETTVLVGVGINTDFKIKLNDRFYIKANLETDMYVHQWTTRESETSFTSVSQIIPKTSSTNNDDSSCALLNLVPSVGFGFKF